MSDAPTGYGEIPKTPARNLNIVCPICHCEVPARDFDRFITASRETWRQQNVIIDQTCQTKCKMDKCCADITIRFVKDSGDIKPYFLISAEPALPIWKKLVNGTWKQLTSTICIGISASIVYQVFHKCNRLFED